MATEKLNDLARLAARIQETYRQQADAVQADPSLSARGKSDRLRDLRDKVAGRLADLRAQADEEVGRALQTARRDAFAPPVPLHADLAARTAIEASYRAACNDADALTDPADALRLLARAHQVGDHLLARAIARKAHERAWRPVLAEYVTLRPEEAEVLERLGAAEAQLGKKQRFARRMLFYQPAEPESER